MLQLPQILDHVVRQRQLLQVCELSKSFEFHDIILSQKQSLALFTVHFRHLVDISNTANTEPVSQTVLCQKTWTEIVLLEVQSDLRGLLRGRIGQ
jgi:hypothetical protein